MKRFFIAGLAYLTLSGVGFAEVADVKLGYSGDELPASGTISYQQTNCDISAAIRIPEGTINTYSGNSIAGVSAGLASKLNIESLTVWVRSDLNGPNLAEATISSETTLKIAKGWNVLEFDTPWEIPADNPNGLYLGYTYHQKNTSFGVAALDVPTPDGFYLKFGDNDWENRSEEGTLCVQALIRGDKLPKVNLQLTNVALPDNFVIHNGTLEISGIVKNLATYTISGFDVTVYTPEGRLLATAPLEVNLPYNESIDFAVVVAIPEDAIVGKRLPITVKIENIKEGEDEDPTDNAVNVETGVVNRDFTHRILVEEFTTEKCPNCPRVGNYLHDALEKEKYQDKVIAICHHSGYYTDWLTISSDNELMWLFNEGGATYAPALMIDRVPTAKQNTVVFNPGSSAEMESYFDQQLHKGAYVSVDIKAEVIDAKNIEVTVDGEVTVDELCENPRVTVYILEDNIAAQNQASAPNWIHQHVGRAINSTWGEPIEIVDGKYSYTCTLKYFETWVPENLKVVAFVSNYDKQDALNCKVFNANEITFPSLEGVEEIITDDSDNVEWYNLQGIRVTNPSDGIFIRRQGNRSQLIRISK